MYASLDGLPSLVGGVLSGCGFCLVWYRLRRLEDLSYRDYQTGLRSGRLLDEDLALLGRTEAPIALLLVDLDDFGRFNAVGYRSHGDRALLLAATTIWRTLQRCGRSDLSDAHRRGRVCDSAHAAQLCPGLCRGGTA